MCRGLRVLIEKICGENMFSITSYIRENLVISSLRAGNKNEAISELVDRIYQVNPSAAGSVKKEKALESVMERESSQSTGVGDGLAFPHARIKGWGACVAVIAASPKGIDFDSVDKKLVHFMVMIITSDTDPYLILRIMAAVIRGVKNNEIFKVLGDGLTAREIYDKFKDQGATELILARDLMRQVKISVKMDDSIESVISLMHLNQLDTLPVVDENNYYKGVISCFDIFTYSIPDFFNQLQTVSFVRHLDPFEKYFTMRHGLTVKDILVKDNYVISQNDTLMEIIFQLSVKNKVKLFVLEEGRLVGEIDRFALIDKILFF